MISLKTTLLPATLGLGALGVAWASTSADAGASSSASAPMPRMYELTITNLSDGQTMSPPLLATHTDGIRMFEPGEPASAELAALAEDGDSSGLATILGNSPEVLDHVAASAGIMPGESATYTIQADATFRWFSMASMFVTTNDAFVGVDSITVDQMAREGKFFVPVWDAGSERNSEDGMYIPGPPFGNGGVHDPAPSEGFVYLHSGIHGIEDVLPEEFDWGSYGALVEFRRL